MLVYVLVLIVCVVGKWLNIEIDNSEVCIQSYSSVRLDHSRHGGGLAIYIHNNIMFSFSVLFKGNPDFEFFMLS